MLFYIIVSVLVVSANAKFYTDCGSKEVGKKATVQNVSVDGCAEDAEECVLNRNTNVTVSIDFTPNEEVTSVETVVSGEVVGVPLQLQFPVFQPDACNDSDSGLNCPLPAGKQANYQTNLPIQQIYLQTKVEIKWELINEFDENIICVKISARIQ